MFNAGYGGKKLLAAAIAVLVAGAAGPASAQGLFDFLFRRPPPPESARSYAPPSSPETSPGMNALASNGAHISGGTGRWSSYCVRLCDGRYFPIARSGGKPGEICSSMCPAAKTKIFSGSDISYASASDGTRYSGLDNAFVYREKVVDDCSCNGKDAFGLVTMDVKDDPTLRRGDMVATANGLEKFTGERKTARASGEDDPGLRRGIQDDAGSVDEAPPPRRVHRRNPFPFFNFP